MQVTFGRTEFGRIVDEPIIHTAFCSLQHMIYV